MLCVRLDISLSKTSSTKMLNKIFSEFLHQIQAALYSDMPWTNDAFECGRTYRVYEIRLGNNVRVLSRVVNSERKFLLINLGVFPVQIISCR